MGSSIVCLLPPSKALRPMDKETDGIPRFTGGSDVRLGGRNHADSRAFGFLNANVSIFRAGIRSLVQHSFRQFIHLSALALSRLGVLFLRGVIGSPIHECFA
jgi:hypothetical protein